MSRLCSESLPMSVESRARKREDAGYVVVNPEGERGR